MKEQDKLFMVLDDTADIGKELSPMTTEKDRAFMERAFALKDKFMAK